MFPRILCFFEVGNECNIIPKNGVERGKIFSTPKKIFFNDVAL